MTTRVEETRQLHADIERCERGIVNCLKERDGLKRHRDVLWNEHRTGHLCSVIGERGAALRDVYADADGTRQGEMQAFSGGGSGEKQFAAFYGRLGEIQDYYQRFPPQALLNPAEEEGGDEESFPSPPEPAWTGEEAWGRFLDLHTFHEIWLNLPGNRAADEEATPYAEFVASFAALAAVPVNKKRAWGPRYASYAGSLRDYLATFAKRAQPLVESDEFRATSKEAFEAQWAAGSVPGWGAAGQTAATEADEDAIDLATFETAAEVAEGVSMEDLKEELTRLGLKCGGNLQQRAERLFMTKNTPMSELPLSVFAGAKGKGKGKGKRKREDAGGTGGAASAASASADELSAKSKDIAWIEFEIAQLCDLMNRVVEQTKIQIEKKQTRTQEELEAELELDGPQDDDSDSDDEEKAIYNPKNLPLGWDGKPIPYWLYKLHGLNIEYNCEICGNYKYYGPRAFDRHFSEWRHTHGLKCLGIGTHADADAARPSFLSEPI